MADDDALAILAEIAANPEAPLHVRVEAKDALEACAKHGIHTCREVIALLIGILAQTPDPTEARH